MNPIHQLMLDFYERIKHGDDKHQQWLKEECTKFGQENEERLQEYFLQWRGVNDPCLKCNGCGQRAYGSTATWRGGIGGQMFTDDVCDACWGTGDRYRTGVDLRRVRDEEAKRVSEEAVDLLARSVGSTFNTCRPHIVSIIEVLQKFADKRGQNFTTSDLALGLANQLRRALGVPEVKQR